jgi:hypothetical protein
LIFGDHINPDTMTGVAEMITYRHARHRDGRSMGCVRCTSGRGWPATSARKPGLAYLLYTANEPAGPPAPVTACTRS